MLFFKIVETILPVIWWKPHSADIAIDLTFSHKYG